MKTFNYNIKAKNKHIKSIDKIVTWHDFTSYKVFIDHVILKNIDDKIIGKITYETLETLQNENYL